MNNGDLPLLSIILAGLDLLVKMLIPLERVGTFGSHFEYLCIETLSRPWYAEVTRLRRASVWQVVVRCL